MSTKQFKSDQSGEAGFAGFVAILSIAVFCLYLKYNEAILTHLFGEKVTPLVDMVMTVVLAVMTLFAVCCAIHMKFIGDHSNRSLVRDVRERSNQITLLVSTSNSHLKSFENDLIAHAGIMTPRAIDCISILKRILKALEQRVHNVDELVSTGDKIDLYDAYELLNKRLKVSTSALDSLIDSDPLPDLEPAEWAPAVGKLLDGISFELRRVA